MCGHETREEPEHIWRIFRRRGCGAAAADDISSQAGWRCDPARPLGGGMSGVSWQRRLDQEAPEEAMRRSRWEQQAELTVEWISV